MELQVKKRDDTFRHAQKAIGDVMEHYGLSCCLDGSVLHELRDQLWTSQTRGNSHGTSDPIRVQQQIPVPPRRPIRVIPVRPKIPVQEEDNGEGYGRILPCVLLSVSHTGSAPFDD
jgi:hypothetical protein